MKGCKPTALWADRVCFRVSGSGARAFLNCAVRQGVRLWGVGCTQDGYIGYAAGADLSRLRQAARTSRAEICIRARQGPGVLLERFALRTGLLVGLAVFFLLQWYLGGFLWSIDFGEMEQEQQRAFRTALAQEGIWEGCRMEEETLRRAQQALEPQMQQTGWFSLNFASGCLFIEETRRQTQNVREETAQQALYAKSGGQVLAIELESGFAEVAAGQYVAAGQLLANGQRADRGGEAVMQGAAGKVWGRMSGRYTATQPLQTETEILTGAHSTWDVWQLLGHIWSPDREDAGQMKTADGMSSTRWIPLRLGGVALPGAVCRTTRWETQTRTVIYSETAARALAARACRLQLLRQFPDAELETQALDFQRQGNEVVCTAEYVFCADMAQPGELSPLETAESTG